ncbi:trans-sulfuration enzyme family protein [Roseospirillum parvum]|uniref:O-succinylhomoserine sulfhydrylase n=1 Tax=Roseospirillum parvum TaxID=83401 RepID=A0A1G8EGE7_9PROT|nr:PLP-dependent transferase [Roseospirillum parvum]SDH69002.1 O-succinylhomoserine sulfhydrylase [Roseospirillum parvum]
MSTDRDNSGWGTETRAVHAGVARSPHQETSEALFLTSGFVYDSAEEAEAAFNGELERFVYSRFRNPTIGQFETRLSALEAPAPGGTVAARATGSGMAALFAALLSQLQAGDRVVAGRALFASTRVLLAEVLPRFGVICDLVDGPDPAVSELATSELAASELAASELAAWEAALATPARLVLIETPTNPTLEVLDIAAIAKLAHGAGARLIVDNVFATPCLQGPLALGADMVVYSTTKHIDGQGRCLGGAILGAPDLLVEVLDPFLRHSGPAMSPFNAWVMLKGLETLPLRVERQAASALKVARALEALPGVLKVSHPGLESHPGHAIAKRQMTAGGPMLAFEVAGGKQGAFNTLNRLRLIAISNNLGDAKSLACHPATTTHQRLEPAEQQRLGITPGLIRLSVGLETPDDLIADLAGAVAKGAPPP